MRMQFLAATVLICGSVLSPTQAIAERTGAQICKKMLADDRGGDMSFDQCLCTHRVAVAVFDEDIQTLLFDSWYNGTNNMSALEKLPKRGRIKRQFRTMERTLRKNCNK